MNHGVAQRVYDVYGRFYGGFEMLFRRRVGRAIERLGLRPGERVLDLGIGTGLSLEFYPPEVEVVGVDLSEGMLRQAARRVQGGIREGRTQLIRGDALALPFAEGAFDCVLMSHMIATVADPYRALEEALRVCRDRGRLAVVNHFRSPYPVVSWLELALDPVCRKLGWRSDLSLRGLLGPMGVRQLRRPEGWVFQTVFLQKSGGELRMAAPGRADWRWKLGVEGAK